MTTYDNILDIIIRRQGELDISNRKLALGIKMVIQICKE